MPTITIASGKGGTGKTTLAINLALAAGEDVALLDCDVEEPNCHLFLKPEITASETVSVMVPVVDHDSCDGCGLCGRICNFSAIVPLQSGPLVFPELCHGCLGCVRVCPQGAVSAGRRPIGWREEGRAGGILYSGGRLRVGESMAPPLIREVRRKAPPARWTIIDAPPGTSCPVIETVRGSDQLILVTEPTPFGLHDLKLSVSMARDIGVRFGVVVNRAGLGDDLVARYCRENGIPLLLEIPEDRRIAEAYSRGAPLIEALPEYGSLFADLLAGLGERLGWETKPTRS
ncbi:MAG: P-loop NTPase [Candidatus Eisenbacteria bacterium]|nr:P-loop NTPase [Candidatus Eisenbacteria bacterium]